MIQFADDRLAFTFPEIARPLRAHVERQIGHLLPEFLRPEEATAARLTPTSPQPASRTPC